MAATFRLATVDEWPISKSMFQAAVMTIKPGAMRKPALET